MGIDIHTVKTLKTNQYSISEYYENSIIMILRALNLSLL